MIQILSLLQAVVLLLTIATGQNATPEFKAQAIKMATNAIALTQQQMVQLTQQTTMETPSTTAPQTQPSTTAPTTTGNFAPAQSAPVAPVSLAKIEIISTSNTSKITDPHVAIEGDPTSNDNILDIGAIVTDQYGEVVTGNVYTNGIMTTQGKITITTTDPNQNTHTYSRSINGQYVFPFEYIFHFAGDHTITYSVEGIYDSHGDAMHDLTGAVTVTAH